MLYYVVYITISILISSSNSKFIRSLKKEPKRCCWTKQFSADVSLTYSIPSLDGTIEKTQGTYSLLYDANSGLMGMKGGSVNGQAHTGEDFIWVIQSIKKKQIYTIDEASKTCSISPMPVMPTECIPAIASYVRSNTYTYNGKKIIADTWLIKSKGTLTYSTVSRDGLCIPLRGEVSVPQTGFSSLQTIIHFVPKITDRSIIDIPEECLHAT